MTDPRQAEFLREALRKAESVPPVRSPTGDDARENRSRTASIQHIRESLERVEAELRK